MHVTIIIPTFDRIQSLQRTIKSIRNSSHKEISIIVVVDGKKAMLEEVMKEPVTIMFNERRMDWPACQNKAIGSWAWTDGVLYGADDIEFPPEGIATAVKAMEKYFPDGDGLIGLDQDCRPKIDSAFGLMGRKFIERFPFRTAFCPQYIHFFSDAEIGAYAKSIKKFYFCKEVILKHTRAQDNTYALGMAKWAKDRATWQERAKKGYLWGRNFSLIGDVKCS